MGADRASLDRNRNLGILTGHVEGDGPEGTLTARELWFWRDEGRIELRDSARVEERKRVLEARRIDYDTRAQVAVAIGDVLILDTEDSTRITGRRCVLDRINDTALVTGSPLLEQPGEESLPDVFLSADTLELRQSDGKGLARGNVHLSRGNLQAESERAVFDFDRDLLHLEGNPVALDPDGEVRGDSMAVVMRGGRAERLEVLGHTTLRYRPRENPGEHNFVLGDTLIARIDSLGVRAIQVAGNARSLYIPSAVDRNKEVGSNLARGNQMFVTFGGGEVQRVEILGQANGEYVRPRIKPDSSAVRLSDSLYVERALDRFLADSNHPLPDSLERSGPFDPNERVVYEGNTVLFLVPKRRIEIRESGRVLYQNLILESEEITYEASRDRVVALGTPTLKDPTSELVGERMVYRLDSQHGFVYQGKTEFEGGYYVGEEIKRVDKKILLVRGGDYTTCDADTAHFHFHSDRMKIRLADKVVARPIVLYLKNIPLMALPYWVFPVRKGRHSGILMPDVEFGFDRKRGRFVRNIGYYYAPNDYSDAMLWGDYYEKNPRWIVNSQFRYKARYRLSGTLFTSYSGQEISGTRSRSWDVRGSHEQTLGERFTLKVRADFVSDKDYRDDREFGGSVDERLNRILKSNVDLRKSWSRTSLSVTANRTENLDQESSSFQVQQNVPSIDFSINSFPLGQTPDEMGHGGRLRALSTVYARIASSFRSTFEKDWDEPMLDNQAARIRTALSDNRSIGPYVKISPSLSATGAWFRWVRKSDRPTKGHQAGAVWDAGVSAQSTVYGTFPIGLGPLIGMRHVVEPSVSYRYAPEFESLRYANGDSRFTSVGGISLSGREVSSMSMKLTQRFHLKMHGEDPKKPRKIDNLILWTTSTSYDFKKQGNNDNDAKPLSSIVNSLRLNVSRHVDNSWTVTHDPYRKVATSLSVQTRLNFSGKGSGAGADSSGSSPLEDYGGFGQADAGTGRPGEKEAVMTGPWSLAISHSYSRGKSRSSESSTLNLSAALAPTSKWRVNYSIYYDLRDRDVRSQSFSVYRDLHCWQMKLDRRISGRTSQYYFRISVKDLPDVQYERQNR